MVNVVSCLCFVVQHWLQLYNTYCGVLYISYKIPFHCLKCYKHLVREYADLFDDSDLYSTRDSRYIATTCPTVTHGLNLSIEIHNVYTLIISGRVLVRQREQTV